MTNPAFLSPKQRLSALVRACDFTPGQFFLGGSSALAVRDIRDVADLDVGVTTRYWVSLLQTGNWNVWTTDPDGPRRCDPPYLVQEFMGVQVHVFSQWRIWSHDETEYNDFNRMFEDGIEMHDGWLPVIRLEILLRQKVDAIVNCMRDGDPPRPKDLTDVRAIATHIEVDEINFREGKRMWWSS